MVAPQGDHGASECEAGVGLWDLNGVNDVRAPLEPRASLIERAPLAQGVLQDGRTGLSENASLGIFWPQKCTFCLTDPLFGSSLAAQKFRIAFNLLRKTLKLTLGRGRTWSVKLYVIFKYTL